ncbi:hypothetical protein ACWGII_29660 [Streptomyces sp. NPDC054855]
MTELSPSADPQADLAALRLEFHHVHQLLAPAEEGIQTWQVRVVVGGQPVGKLRATRGLYWKSDNLRERMGDEQAFLAVVAEQLLNPDGSRSRELEDFAEMISGVLVIDQLQMSAPWDDSLIVATVAASIVERLTDNFYAVVFPRSGAPGSEGAALLEQAGILLSAMPFSDELLILDTCQAAPERATHKVRDLLRGRARYGGIDSAETDRNEWEDDEDGHQVLTARTAVVLCLALSALSKQAWQEVAALGDEPLRRGAGGLFGALPPVTLGRDGRWRRHMARAFDDLAADLIAGAEVKPRCTGEEMALHLGIAHARAMERNRPRLVREAVGELPAHRRDYDWDACSDCLFQGRDVLMLFDGSFVGFEDSDIGQAMDNLAPADWFAPFDSVHARDPARGFRHS